MTFRAFRTTVSRVEPLSPNLVRITLADPCLADLAVGGARGPRDLRVKVVVPSPGHPLPDLSDLSDGWYARWLALDPDVRGAMRTYTVRRARLDAPVPEVDVDVVLHGHSAGPASAWAAAAQVGDGLTLLGVHRDAGLEDAGIEWRPPAGPLRVLLAGDETAAPAICSVLESLPPDAVGHALVEVPDARDTQEVRATSGVALQWLARGDAPRGQALLAAVDRVLDPAAAPRGSHQPEEDPDELLWETPREPAAELYAWVAGEAGVVRALRRRLAGLDRSAVAFMGYWREGRAAG